jgi:DNA-binding NarL/FixJ family response regulator
MADRKKILIVDDHPLFREGLKSIIERNPDYEVTGEAGNGREAVKLTKKCGPDLILMDLSLPDKDGIELTREIRSLMPETKIIVVTMHSKVNYIAKAFQAGATGYVVKESASERLLQGMEAVLNGEYFMDSSVSHKVVKKLLDMPLREKKINDASYNTLTSREQEVMSLLAQGIASKDIAERLFISPKTVENHRSNIMNKLDLHSTHELVRFAARIGLIDVDLWKE